MRALRLDNRFQPKTNQVTNPSFEDSSGTGSVERWTNLHPNPSWGVTSGFAGSAGSGASATVSYPSDGGRYGNTYARWTYSVGGAAGGYGYYSAIRVAVVPGRTVTASYHVRPNRTRNMRVYLVFYDNDGVSVSPSSIGTVISCPPGVWTRLSHTTTLGANTYQMHILMHSTDTTVAGDIVDFDGMMATETPYLVPYFDGTSIDPQFGIEATSAWTGTANQSPSTLSTPIPTTTCRTNLATRPNVEIDSGWYSNSNPLYARLWDNAFARSGTRSVRFTRTAATPNTTLGSAYGIGHSGSSQADNIPVVVGETYTVSVYQRAGQAGYRGRIGIQWRDAANAIIGSTTYGSYVSLVVGDWVRVSSTATAPENATVLLVIATTETLSGGGNAVENDYVNYDDCLIEKGSVLGDYFDGSYGSTYDMDMVCSWSGTADASTSSAKGLPITGTSSTSNTAGIQSYQWANRGVSLRLIPIGSITQTYVAPGGDIVTNTIRNGILPGRTYTAIARLRLTAVQTSPGANARTINLLTRVGAGTIVQTYSTPAPNTVGEHIVRYTFTIPSDVTGTAIRLYSGSGPGDASVWWDDFMIVEEPNYAVGYVDGTLPRAKWLGTAHASSSVGYPGP